MLTKNELIDIYDRGYKRLFRSSLRVVGDRMEAEEIVHDTLLKLWNFEGELTPQQQDAWLYKSCIRASIDRVRKRVQMREDIGEEIPDREEESLEDSREVAKKVEEIRAGMERLPEGYRVVLSLYLFEGFDYQEISELLGVSESTVRSQYMRGKRKLIDIIDS